jgi:hypothetical protein
MFASGRSPTFSKIALVIILVIALVSVGVLPFLSNAAGEAGTLTFRVGSLAVKTVTVNAADENGVLLSSGMLPSAAELAAALPENADVVGWRATVFVLENAESAGNTDPAAGTMGAEQGVLSPDVSHPAAALPNLADSGDSSSQAATPLLVPTEDPYIYTEDLSLVAQYPGIYRATGDFVIFGETVFDAVLGEAPGTAWVPGGLQALDGPVLTISDENGMPLTDLMIGLSESRHVHVSAAGLSRASVTGSSPAEDRTLLIAIPEGLTVVSYEGLDGASLPDDFQDRVSLRQEPFDSALPGQPVSARFGDIVYGLSSDTDAVELNIVVAVDKSRFYGSHTLPSPIKAVIAGGALELSGAVNVHAEATASDAFGEQIAADRSIPYTIAVNGVETETNPAAIYKYCSSGTYPISVPAGSVTFTYPETAALTGVFYDASHAPNGSVPQNLAGNIYGGPGGNEHIVHDAGARTVTFYYENTQFGNFPGLRLLFAGERFGTIRDVPVRAEYTAYDGVSVVLTNSGSDFRFQFLGDAGLLAAEGSWEAAPTDLPGLTLVNRIRFVNPQETGLANQIVRYDFPRELGVRAFEAPVEDNSSPVSIQYKVYGDPALHTLTSRGNVVNPDARGGKLRFSPAQLGLREGEILEWAEADVGDFAADYEQGRSAVSGCLIFGNIAPGTAMGTIYTISVAIRPEDGGVSAIPAETVVNAATTVSPPANAILLNVSMEPSSRSGEYSYAAGEEIFVRARLGLPSGTAAGTIQRIANPEMYILLPRNVSIVSESLMLTMSDRSVLRELRAFLLQDGSGRTLVRIYSNAVIGQMASDLNPYGDLELSFGMVGVAGMPVFAADSGGLVFGGPAVGDPLQVEESDDSVRVVDSEDLDGDGDTTEYIVGAGGALLDFVIAPENTASPPSELPVSNGSGPDRASENAGGASDSADSADTGGLGAESGGIGGSSGLGAADNSSMRGFGYGVGKGGFPIGTDTSAASPENAIADSSVPDVGPAPEVSAPPPSLNEGVPESVGGIGSNGVPLSNLTAVNVWSLLSMILAFISVLLSVLLSVEAVAGRKNALNQKNVGTYYEQEETKKIQKQRVLLRYLAIIIGFLTLAVWLISDDPLLPMAWINRWTILVVVIFIVHVALFVEIKLQSRNDAEAAREANFPE